MSSFRLNDSTPNRNSLFETSCTNFSAQNSDRSSFVRESMPNEEVDDTIFSEGSPSLNQNLSGNALSGEVVDDSLLPSNRPSLEQNVSSNVKAISQNVSLTEGVSDDVLNPIDPLTAALTSESLSDSIVAAIQMMESNTVPDSDNNLTHADNIATPRHRKNVIFSSDEDVEPDIGTDKPRRGRIRRICSDSEDDDIVTSPNSTFRQPKIVFDSEEESEEEYVNINQGQDVSNAEKADSIQEGQKVNIVEKEHNNDSESSQDDLVDDLHKDNHGDSYKHDHDDSHKHDHPDSHEHHKSCKHHNHKKDKNVIDVDKNNSSNASDIIDVSSEDDSEVRPLREINTSRKNSDKKTLTQPKLDSMLQNMSLAEIKKEPGDAYHCSAAEYSNQATKVSNLRTEVLQCKNARRAVNLDSLPDKGALLQQRLRNLESKLSREEDQLKKMVVHDGDQNKKKVISWEQLVENSNCVVPKTMGKTAVNTHTVSKTLTMERLKQLHNSLATCPDENTFAEDPKGLKIELMPHQKRGLAWLLWREGQKPPGGILADDMGLGKTLSMISLILFTKDMDTKENSSDSEDENREQTWHSKKSKFNAEGGTLIICPATLIRQWEGEVSCRVKRGLLTCEVYHGPNRETNARRLAKYDMVITTYKLVQGEYEKKGPLFGVKWKRIILDEAHVIRNCKAQTSVAACALKGKARWALTGTPVHNKELDLYALLKFLRCSPFDDLGIWKYWVANKQTGGQDRLNTVIKSILLRRTKAQLQIDGALKALPEKKFEELMVELDANEKQIYQKVLIFSRTMFIEFLRQRAEKNPEFAYMQGNLKETNDEQYNKMHQKVLKAHGGADIKSHEILVLLLRLRQICCHPSLIHKMLDQENCAAEGIEEDGLDVDLFDKFDKMNLDDNDDQSHGNQNETVAENFSTVASKVLSSSNPVFASDRPNEKLRLIRKIVEEKVIAKGDKIIIVSQWTSMLNLIYQHLKEAKIKCDMLDGKVPVNKRNDIVVNFNDPQHRIQVLLLSLTAGGVGLNLVGANHLLLVDLHWNPQLESQAQDRIYRVGQKKPVFIYKIITTDTIEEKIKALQDAKLQMAGDILSGARAGAGSKLSMDDLKMLFNIGST